MQRRFTKLLYLILYSLHIVRMQSYTETDHIIDVYETMTIKQASVDFFAGTRTNPAVTIGTAFDSCRPAGYEFTGIWSYSTPSNGAHTPGSHSSIVTICVYSLNLF
jgi:hypothetical protein